MILSSFHIICLCLIIYEGRCFIFNEQNAIQFQKHNLKHFGSSVFLQKGNPTSYLFAGGYKNKLEEDAISSCAIDSTKKCEEIIMPKVDERKYIRSLSLFGRNIEGGVNEDDPIMVCAPRYTRLYKSRFEHYLPNGACFYSFDKCKTFEIVDPNSENNQQIENNTYSLGFGQAGFSSYYFEKEKRFLLGSPGLYTWKGGIITVYEPDIGSPIQTRQLDNFIEYASKRISFEREKLMDGDYAGYAVAIAEFFPNEISYVFSLPKANDLKGKVYIIKNSNPKPVELLGNSTGSFYGSVICVADVNGDGLPDLLVGAPTFQKKIYNEGAVYVYLNKKGIFTSKHHQELSPATANNSMFGYAITNLGKISKENFDVIAISSPYEDNGEGCVYIYTWDKTELKMRQKIKGKSLEGFGASISKPIEIGDDGVFYLAVGAYKSNTVKILKSKSVFHYQFTVKSVNSLMSYEERKPFNITYCISLNGAERVNTSISLHLDKRVIGKYIPFYEETIIKKKYCNTLTVSLVDDVIDEITPLWFRIFVQEEDCPDCPSANPSFPREFNYKIPFIYKCGSDNICTPKLEISTNINSEELIVGQKSSLKVMVNVKNTEEYAYLCNLSMILPQEIQFTSVTKNCERDNTDCKLRNPLKTEETLNFDVSLEDLNILPYLDALTFVVKVACQNYTIDSLSTVYLKYESKLNVETSKNESIVYDATNITTGLKGKYSFLIKNEGPSPIQNYKFLIKVPRKLNILGDVKIFDIYKPQLTGNSLSCIEQDYDEEITKTESFSPDGINIPDDEVKSAQFLSSSKPNEINCNDLGVDCMEITCTTTLKKNEYCKILIPVKSHTDQIIKHYERTFDAVATLIYTEKNENLSKDSVIKFINKTPKQNLAMWIIIGVLLGLLFLTGVIILLYRYNFFTRTYKIMREEENVQEPEVGATGEKPEAQEMEDVL